MADALTTLLLRFRRLPDAPTGTGIPIYRSALLWILLCLLSLSGSLLPIDGWIFDGMVRAPPHSPGRSAAALVQAPAAMTGVATSRLLAAGATRVVPLGQDTDRRPHSQGTEACRPRPVQGMVRDLPMRDTAGQPCPIALAIRGLTGRPVTAAKLSPDFSIATSTALPRVSLGGNESAATLQAVVAGRTVLLSIGARPAAYVTPLFGTDGWLDEPMLDAMLIDSILQRRAVRWLPAGADVALAVVVALALQLAFHRRRYRAALAVALASIPLVLLLGGLLIRGAGVHVPMTATLLAIGVFALRTILRRNRTLGDTLVDLDHRLTGLVQQPLNRTFAQNPELTWDQVNHFVTRFFDLKRSVMLDLPAGQVYLTAASALGCSMDDIIEKRRDYRRAPYSTSLARERPTPPSRPFLPATEGLIDLIAPLTAADQLVGFWAFSVAALPEAELEALLLEAARYADEVAKVVLRSRNALVPTTEGTRQAIPLAQVRSRLLDGASQAREQLAAYRDVFSAVGHAIAVTDLLGRILFTNPRFEQLAASASKPLLAMSVHDMLKQLCGLDASEAKDVLRRVMLQTGTEDAELPARHLGVALDYSVFLHPIRRDGRRGSAIQASPFDLLGLVVEISPSAVDADMAGRLQRSMQDYVRRTQALLVQALRAADRVAPADHARDMLTDQLMRGLNDARQVDLMLQAASGQGAGTPVSIDLVQMVYRARQACAIPAAEKDARIGIAEGGPRTVIAHPDALRTVLADAFAVLVEDAVPGGRVDVAWHASEDLQAVLLSMSNEGYGLPPRHVADVMRAGGTVLPAGGGASLLDRLAQSAHALDASTPFTITSELGKGYAMRMVFPRDTQFRPG
ncbi:MAG: hypothetical protein M3374_01130 [Pseudomonadota bacterium]|nr:hypothetical protein [Pseudomonadota bacterium]